MREIKFRAWDKENKGYIVEPIIVGFLENTTRVFVYRGSQLVEVPNCDVIQYTGLSDKNGKEIYEGDIVKLPNEEICEVIYSNRGASFCLNDRFSPQFFLYRCGLSSYNNLEGQSKCEIIGNIYENKELLK